ncbi:MAG: WD40 repeat domain-containing protein [Vulcanimicrobiota bacterium]
MRSLPWLALLLAACTPASAPPSPTPVESATPAAPLVVMSGHSGQVCALAFSEDGKWLASGSDSDMGEGGTCVWDLTSGSQLAYLPSGSVSQLQFHPRDKNQLMVAGRDGVSLWSVATGDKLKALANHPTVTAGYNADGSAYGWQGIDFWVFDSKGSSVAKTHFSDRAALSPDVHLAAVGLELYRAGKGDPVRKLQAPDGFTWEDDLSAEAFSLDGKLVAGVHAQKTYLWETSSGKLLATLPSGKESNLVFTPDHGLISGTAVWDLGTRKLRSRIPFSSYRALSKDGKTLALGGADQVELVDLATHKQIQVFGGRGKVNSTFALSSHQLVLGQGLLFDLTTGIQVGQFKSWNSVFAAFSGDGRSLASTGPEGLEFWDVNTHKRLAVNKDCSPNFALAWQTNQVWASQDGALVAFEAGTARRLRAIPRPDKRFTDVDGIAIDKDGKSLWAAYRGANCLIHWQLSSGKSSQFPVKDAEFPLLSPDGQWLALLSHGFQIWNLAGEKVAGDERYAFCTAFSPDSKRLAVWTEDVQLFGVPKGEPLKTLPLSGSPKGLLAFSPDGRILFSYSLAKKVQMCDLASGEIVGEMNLIGESDWILTTPDGRYDGTENGLKHLRRRLGVRLESVDLAGRSPGLLAQLLDGRK